jgi:hypothetical protein
MGAVAIAEGAVAIVGVGGSFGLAGESRKLRWDFPSAFDSGVQDAVRAHNEALRNELGLLASDIKAIDEGRSSP